LPGAAEFADIRSAEVCKADQVTLGETEIIKFDHSFKSLPAFHFSGMAIATPVTVL
jgi:hypothetical protein